MNSIIDALYELKYNPFEYGPYLASFYTALKESENNLLLAQLVIPLCSHPFFSLKLKSSTVNSTIFTIFNGETMLKTEHDKDKYRKSIFKLNQNKIIHKEQLYDLQERIDEFQALTKQSIQYCLVSDWLSVSEERLSLKQCDESDSKFIVQKSAERLGRLFSEHSVVEIFDFLGVKPR